ncbi:hypothetical protein GWC77_11005 [Paraburkholderia sp. NMBU_R16]|uniref:hypothetical protein n=1 Tax=Paraburkholderia sp. NMBU_R16 TaxID=2698676 RepID=UPI0015671072|nr:hypothetical protein [Paraburkholderia sp. NMBU_R16]NRO96460.1 hypothetical protein [Paraburkholderia sp. NMBU_R16]
MQAYEMRYVPGQIHVTRLRRASSIVAIEGTLTLRYRDESLNWLLDATPINHVRLGEGEGYRLPCDAFVEISTAGKTGAVGAVEPASTAFARCAAWIVNTAIPRWLKLPQPAR